MTARERSERERFRYEDFPCGREEPGAGRGWDQCRSARCNYLVRIQTELKELTASWPSSRLLEIWKRLPGVTAVRRFTSRSAAVSRIWKAVQTLEASRAERQAGSEPGSRKDQLIAMLQTPGGATLPQLMQASGWQAHSVMPHRFHAVLGTPLFRAGKVRGFFHSSRG
jgi:hypothetical protein